MSSELEIELSFATRELIVDVAGNVARADFGLSFAGGGSSKASKVLMRGLKDLRASSEGGKFDVLVGDDLYNWVVTMPSASFIDDAPELFGDLERLLLHNLGDALRRLSRTPLQVCREI